MRKTFVLSLMCISVLALAGCASKNSGMNYAAYYPECREPILEIESLGASGKGAAKGGLTGGLVGGTVGFLLGVLLNGGNVANAGISAAVGAATGGATGAISGAMTSGSKYENALLAKYYEQINGDISGLDLRQAAGTVALQCYQKKLTQLEELEKLGRLSEAASENRKMEIEKGMAEARGLIGNLKNTDPEKSIAEPQP